MKRQQIYIMIIFMSLNVCSQEIIQQSDIELNDMMKSDVSYLCQATTSIELKPGFAYTPDKGVEMIVEIDRYSVFPPANDYFGGVMPGDNGVVGALYSDYNVSNSGAAVYSIDLKLPNAIGTMIPKLSLVYNNQSGNGIMGWSWNVGGMSSIDRVPQTDYHDGEVTNIDFINDRYAIDGQRLMLVAGDDYGTDGTEYRTEIDNMDKIVSCSNNKGTRYFVVYKSDGTIWEYGQTSDARLEAKTDNQVILKWNLSKISDRNGNSIIFTYDKNVNTGESYIDNIQYTYNEKADVSPAYKIQFVYDSREQDPTNVYVCGNMLTNRRLLKNILVMNNYTRQIVFDYSLEYDNPGTYNGAYFIHYRLKSVGLTIGGDEINPTRIIWNSEKKHYPSHEGQFRLHQLNKSVFSNVPFVGDFNGDGFSDVLMIPYKIQNSYPNDVTGEIYINNGDGTFDDEPFMSVRFDRTLEWIYVVDMDDDGVDDIIPYEYNYDNNESTIHFYLIDGGLPVRKKTFVYANSVAVLPGKYVNKDNKGVLVFDTYDGNGGNVNMATYICYKDGDFINTYIPGTEFLNGGDYNYVVMDMSGDGLCELLVLDDNGYRLYKVGSNNMDFKLLHHGSFLTKNDCFFPNDYNADGKTDILYYEDSRCWNILFSKGNAFESPMSCYNTMLKNVVLNAKDKYRYSLKELDEPNVTIRTADFDGDGVADVGVVKNAAGNHYIEIGFKPIIKTGNTCEFASERRFYMPINYSHQTIQVGRFLAQENVSLLSGLPRNPHSSAKAYIASLLPHSVYYSVERIVDGLGNSIGFAYDYLMQKGNAQEKFYTSDNKLLSNDIRHMSIPISALKSDTSYNVNDVPIVSNYRYYNALVHTKGHGFLGFEKVIERNYIDDELFQKEVRTYETMTMNEHSFSLPQMTRTYRGESQLIKESSCSFGKYVCTANDKVVIPLVVDKYDIVYDLDDHNKTKKFTIERNAYDSDGTPGGNTYSKIVKLNSITAGYDNCMNLYPETCQYVKVVSMSYDNNMDDWLINRPSRISEVVYDVAGNVRGNVRCIEYNNDNTLQVAKEVKIPNEKGDSSDSLSLSIEYEYDKVGNVVQRTMTSPSFEYEKTIKYEFEESSGYRYKTKTVDELGREIKCEYDDLGLLMSTTDYNGFVILNEEILSGVTDVVTLSNGIKVSKAIRWANNHEYSPSNASYYHWEKTTGQAEKLIFYHKSGRELRTVTFDISGKAIFVDKEYDDYGNIKRQTMPYYPGEEMYYVCYVYDKYCRLVETSYPNGMIENNLYEGNFVTAESLSPNGERRYRKDCFNVMDWLVSTEDADGNVVTYEYYSNGLVESAQLEGNEKSKVSVTYDNNGNKSMLIDPNYGVVKYEYDALGNVKKIVSPKKNVLEFKYDKLGRLLFRKEKDVVHNKDVVVQILYDDEIGKKGLVKRIISSEGHCMDYKYDDNLRLISAIETINGIEYETSYKYDDADRITSICYPSGINVLKVYSNSGYEKEIYDTDNNMLLWRTTDMLASGAVAKYELGNGIESVRSYNPKTMALENIYTSNRGKVFRNVKYEYDVYGNLMSRRDLSNLTEECFEYDKLNRLVKGNRNGKESCNVVYDDLGNISEKESDGVMVLYDAIYDKIRPNAIVKAKTDDEKAFRGLNQEVDYSTYDNVMSISKGRDCVSIDYGIDHDRIFMKYVVDGKVKSKTYVSDCEIVKEDGNEMTFTYLNGPVGVFAVYTTDADGEKSINYVHKDNLGSWSVITDEDREVVQRLDYDAWGNVDVIYSRYNGKEGSLLFDRGFGGHEHLVDFGLINMNGRMYDPLLSMMLSPDNNIQMPQMFQNYNRYSYCYNNPLKYNDPSGEWVESVVLGVVGGATNVLFNARNIDSFGEGALLFGVGFVKGFLTEYTMGQSWYLQVGVSAVMEGVTSGVNQMVEVGSGDFKFSGDDWNSIKTSALYGLGSGLVNGVMYTNVSPIDAEDPGTSIQDMMLYDEVSIAMTSVAAHAMGCWFSGQPFLQTMKLKDIGINFKMLETLALRKLEERIGASKFAKDVVDKRCLEIKESILNDLRQVYPDINDIDMSCYLSYVCIEQGRLYISGDIFAMIPAEIIPIIPKPYYDEISSFPLSYSLFRTIF